MSWLMGILSGAWGVIAAVGAAAFALLAVLAGARKAGRDEQKAKDAEERNENLAKIQDAIDASNRIDPDVMSDPNNRLRRK